MCLHMTKKKTEKAKKNKTGKVVRYKVVMVDSQFHPCYLDSVMNDHRWTPGWNKSNRKSTTFSHYEEFDGIYYGIHVFITRKKARTWYFGYSNRNPRYNRLLKVVCYNKDLVAVGSSDDEVYTKVFVPKDEYNNALNRKCVEGR